MAKKLALLIGNDQYTDSRFAPLAVPAEDVRALEQLLKRSDISGFDEIDILLNEPLSIVQREIARLFANKHKDDLLLLYFSGHGVRDSAGDLYLALKDTQHDLPWGTAVDASFVKQMMNKSRSHRQVLILDCCHSGAFDRGSTKSAGTKGIGESVMSRETFEVKGYAREVLTSSAATQLSWEGDKMLGNTERSLFTHFLVQGLETGAAAPEGSEQITVEQLYEYAHDQVVRAQPAMNPQRWVYGQKGSLVIARNPKPVIQPKELPEELRQALESPLYFVREGAVRDLERRLRNNDPAEVLAAQRALEQQYPKERDYVVRQVIEEILARVEDTKPYASAQPSPSKASKRSGLAKHEDLSVFHDTLKDGSQGPDMVVIPAGRFLMGSPESEEGRYDDEGLQHEVTIAKPFALGRYALTVGQFRHFVETADYKTEAEQGGDDEDWQRPGFEQGDDHPVVYVSWNDAIVYIKWLAERTGKPYRLPSETEWEYSARAGTTTARYWGDELGSNRANCDGCGSRWDNKQTAPVGSFKPNDFGLYDTLGNVWEWVQDCWHDNYEGAPADGSAWESGGDGLRVLRGGSWFHRPGHVRSAVRFGPTPDWRYFDRGFRLAQDL